MVWRVRRLVTAALAAATALVVAGVAPNSPAQANQVPAQVNQFAATAVIESVRPATITPSTEKFTISGTVENTGDEPLENLQVLPRWSLNPTPIRARGELKDVFDPDFPWGPLTNTSERDDEPYTQHGTVEPGKTISFELTFENDHFTERFTEAGVYPIGVDVRAGADRKTYDSPHTIVTWLPDDVELPEVPVAVAWPVTGKPSILPDGEFIDDSAAGDIGADGRLSNLVNAAQSTDAPVSWLVDPDVLATVDAMRDGYQVRTEGDRVDGGGASDAAEWRDSFDAATAGGDVHLLPANQPDLGAVRQSDPELAAELATRAVDRSRDTAATGDWKSRIAWFDTPTFDAKSLAMLAGAGVHTAVVRSSAVTAGSPVSTMVPPTAPASAAGENESDAVAVLATDPNLDSTFTAENTAFELRQRWAAEANLTALEAHEEGTDVEPLIAAPPQDWSPTSTEAAAVLDAWTSAPSINPVTVSALWETSTDVAAEPRENETKPALNEAAVRELVTLNAESTVFTALVGDAASAGGQLTDAVLRASSMSWRDDPDGSLQYSSLITEEIKKSIEDVKVIVRDSVTLTSGSGEFPLTIENTLDTAVTVSLDVTSSNRDRLTVDAVPVQRVEPGEKVTVAVSAEATANGRVPVTVQLVTADGDKIGETYRTVVNATQYGTIAWVIVAGAGLLLGAGIVRRIVRGRTRPRGGDNLEASSDEPAEKVAQ